MTSVIVIITVIAGLAASAVLVALSLRAGRVQPEHRWLWVLSLIAIGASALFHGAVTIVMLLSGGSTDAWVVGLGTLALVACFVGAIWRPRWAAWLLIGTGLGQPALLWMLQMLTGPPVNEGIPAEGMLMFYGVPAVITGALLLLSTWRRHGSAPVGRLPASVQ